MDATTGIDWPLTLALIALSIFFIGRELTCWYFKINEGRKNERQIIANQQQLIELLEQQNQPHRDHEPGPKLHAQPNPLAPRVTAPSQQSHRPAAQ